MAAPLASVATNPLVVIADTKAFLVVKVSLSARARTSVIEMLPSSKGSPGVTEIRVPP